jgi:thioredoxin reductase (NADPH)
VDEKKAVTADSVIISTGASARYLGLENERRLLGRGVSACATCDGAFFRDVELAIVGGGDTAMEEALFLTRFASRVHVIHRRGELRASKILQQRVLDHPDIEIHWHRQVADILGEEKVTSLKLEDPRTGELEHLDIGGVFIAIGHTPNTGIFRGQLDTDANGYLRTEPGTTRTSREGVFACGDVQDPVYRQAITAAGTGAMAALDAERWLAEQSSGATEHPEDTSTAEASTAEASTAEASTAEASTTEAAELRLAS